MALYKYFNHFGICWCSAPLTSKLRLAETLHKQIRLKSDLHEPDYLVSMEPEIPVYDCLNIQMKSYDFALVENYQKYVHKYAKIMNLEVDDCWATPAQKLKIQRFKPNSTAVDAEYYLNLYERNVQVNDVPATVYQTLLRVLQATLPEGVELSVHEATEDQQEIRYVPDNKLLELKQQLDEMGGPKVEKKKKN